MRLQPDVVVTDITMPILSGIQAAIKVREQFPTIRVIFLTTHSEPVYLQAAVAAGASGYVLKADAYEELPGVIWKALAGERSMLSKQTLKHEIGTRTTL
jgi:DNA-binding NarL/FixJ family response regulator